MVPHLYFSDSEDYKRHEPAILSIADYLLSVPATCATPEARIASQTLLRWMRGTPHFVFQIDGRVADIAKSNSTALTPLLASMASFVLRHREQASDPAQVRLNSCLIFLNYCEQKNSGVKMTRGIRKALEAKQKGELDKHLSM